MRIAFSGAHCTGKTTLIARLAEIEPEYEVLEEPYVTLEEDGYEFAHPPCFEDYEAQLRCSLDSLKEAWQDAFVDRCPLDFVAYMRGIGEELDEREWLEELREVMQKVDLLVFVPIEEPDEIHVDRSELPALRRRVDQALRELVLDDSYQLGVRTIEVEGAVEARAKQVCEAMKASGPRRA